jgi:hypothetical protein
LLVTLGPALVTTEGYSAAEVGQTHERALDLFEASGRSPHFRDSERRLGVPYGVGRSGRRGSSASRPPVTIGANASKSRKKNLLSIWTILPGAGQSAIASGSYSLTEQRPCSTMDLIDRRG